MPDTDDINVEELREHIDELAARAAALRECGEQAGIPAVERNAKRIEDTVTMLEMNVPSDTKEK